jgi:hypothetical protein
LDKTRSVSALGGLAQLAKICPARCFSCPVFFAGCTTFFKKSGRINIMTNVIFIFTSTILRDTIRTATEITSDFILGDKQIIKKNWISSRQFYLNISN